MKGHAKYSEMKKQVQERGVFLRDRDVNITGASITPGGTSSDLDDDQKKPPTVASRAVSFDETTRSKRQRSKPKYKELPDFESESSEPSDAEPSDDEPSDDEPSDDEFEFTG